VIESLLANHILELGMTEELSVSPDSLTLMDEGSYHGANTDIGLHLSNSDVIDVRELDVKQEIGRGTTGSTYLSLWRSTKVAVKVRARVGCRPLSPLQHERVCALGKSLIFGPYLTRGLKLGLIFEGEPP
jgi:hypothetical protein